MSSRSWMSIAALSVLAACTAPTPPAPPPVAVTVMTVLPRPATVEAEYVAELAASNTVEIRPRVSGLLERQVAVEGQAVKKGQVLFVIDRQPYVAALEQAKAALAQAEATLQQAERDLARVQPLSELEAVSQQELDAAVARERASRAAVIAARAAVRTAELNLEYTVVSAPVDGIVGRAQFRVGGLVTAYQSLLTTLYDTDPMYVNFSISEQRMLELQRRFGADAADHYRNPDSFRILLADGSVYPHPARLTLVDAAVDRRTGTLPVRLEVANPDGRLRDGQFARVIVAVDHIDDALLVPQRAVQELQGKTSLWVVSADNHVHNRDVRMGPRIGADWLVAEGLKPGETIVVDGLQRLRPGIEVKPESLSAPAGDST
ncbi:membrane fusion protein, multidrug efflux system [Fontimonas thermophila]|uniref:Membrane fusion protein, multidrug efflux system n=1 Tax=Fontimonas thermophila TaxID=1076937 RepID=A0A1I2J918_9GAMM|nr:efflux RND transporter periplasmic adaptor subunit [Fontimonas thermophila]SFF50829.1 membrane fusion protein, multidrug efflux system [Fontimonas thermophila]